MVLNKNMYDDCGEKRYPFLKSKGWEKISGTAIWDAQGCLQELGFFTKQDGAFGSDMEATVKEFQKTYGLTVDGVIGERETLNELIELVNNQAQSNESLFHRLTKTIDRVGGKHTYRDGLTYIVGVGCNRKRLFRLNEYDDLIYVINNDLAEKVVPFKASLDPGVDGARQISAPQQIWYCKSLHHWKKGNNCLRPIQNQSIKFTNYPPHYAAVNIHWAGKKKWVKRWSEGCQVIHGGKKGEFYAKFMELTWYNKTQSNFLYTLITSDYLRSF